MKGTQLTSLARRTFLFTKLSIKSMNVIEFIKLCAGKSTEKID